jgi:hypothetical protein
MARAENRKLSRDQRTVDPPTEIHLFKNSIRKKEINDEMLQLLATVSIECNKEIIVLISNVMNLNQLIEDYFKQILM